ncbi:MAG: transglycosylase SLT domain-containing protein [Chloroflexota bacterium]
MSSRDNRDYNEQLPDEDDGGSPRPRRKRTADSPNTAPPAKKQASPKTRSENQRSEKPKVKKPAPIDWGKWRGGTTRERIQRIRWLLIMAWRTAPAWLIGLIVLALFGPGILRSLRPVPTIAPFFTREVQYWSPQIAKWSTEYDVNPNLIATLMQIESCGLPGAASSVGAQGLFQVMPMHFEDNENPTDPETNAKRGISVIRECLGYSEGDVGLAMACYNGGPSLIYRASASWPEESQRYYTWGTGIYNDAVRGIDTSATLDDWVNSGGIGLCQTAASALGLPTEQAPAFVAPSTDRPTDRPALPTVVIIPLATAQFTTQPFQNTPGSLPTFAP